MAAQAADILDDILAALRATNAFRLLTLGDSAPSSDVPRAWVCYLGQEFYPADDDATARWARLRASVNIRVRSTDVLQAITRANELANAATEALLDDPFRGGHCRHLPIGQATEVSCSGIPAGIRRPELEISLDVRCHFQLQESS